MTDIKPVLDWKARPRWPYPITRDTAWVLVAAHIRDGNAIEPRWAMSDIVSKIYRDGAVLKWLLQLTEKSCEIKDDLPLHERPGYPVQLTFSARDVVEIGNGILDEAGKHLAAGLDSSGSYLLHIAATIEWLLGLACAAPVFNWTESSEISL